MDINDEIRRIEFALAAEAQMDGKSSEYREGFIAGCRFLLNFESERYHRVEKRLAGVKGETDGR